MLLQHSRLGLTAPVLLGEMVAHGLVEHDQGAADIAAERQVRRVRYHAKSRLVVVEVEVEVEVAVMVVVKVVVVVVEVVEVEERRSRRHTRWE